MRKKVIEIYWDDDIGKTIVDRVGIDDLDPIDIMHLTTDLIASIALVQDKALAKIMFKESDSRRRG